MIGFQYISKDEIEMLSSFDVNHELYFPCYNPNRFSAAPKLVLKSLATKGLVKKGRPNRLTDRGIKYIKELNLC